MIFFRKTNHDQRKEETIATNNKYTEEKKNSIPPKFQVRIKKIEKQIKRKQITTKQTKKNYDSVSAALDVLLIGVAMMMPAGGVVDDDRANFVVNIVGDDDDDEVAINIVVVCSTQKKKISCKISNNKNKTKTTK